MNSGIKTFYALRTVTKRFIFWSWTSTVVVGTTRASNWLWAERHLAMDGIIYDQLTQEV